VLFSCASALLASDPTLEIIDGAPGEVVSPEVRAALRPEGYRISRDGKVLAEIWLRKDLPAEASQEGALGVSFGGFEVGFLLGVVHLAEEWSDYRETKVAPGDYTLRYGLQPADGDHMGVAEYRDYCLLLDAATDKDPNESFTEEELVELSTQVSKKVHPAVIALFPIWDELDGPQLVRNEIDQWTLAVPIEGAVLGLVFEGHGQI
jgi:hypothetical protein